MLSLLTLLHLLLVLGIRLLIHRRDGQAEAFCLETLAHRPLYERRRLFIVDYSLLGQTQLLFSFFKLLHLPLKLFLLFLNLLQSLQAHFSAPSIHNTLFLLRRFSLIEFMIWQTSLHLRLLSLFIKLLDRQLRFVLLILVHFVDGSSLFLFLLVYFNGL